MDVTQALHDAENALRDFIAAELGRVLGVGWEEQSGVSLERVAKWRERKDAEAKRQPSGVVDERLIYYADFYDLKTILKKHWQDVFSEALGEWKTLEVYLSELEKLRDPDAHRRELLPHQKHLVLGISGEIRTRVVRYRSKRETSADCFPRIESARDSLGNIWVPSGSDWAVKVVTTNMTLRPGDSIDFVVSARDPEDLPLEYGIRHEALDRIAWQASESFSVALTEKHIASNCDISLYIRAPRSYHASALYDDRVTFFYTVLPRR
jgi:hypothetical protein